MKWITHECPKIDHTACAWLIKNFVDSYSECICVPKEKVSEKARELDAIPYDLPGAAYTYEVIFALSTTSSKNTTSLTPRSIRLQRSFEGLTLIALTSLLKQLGSGQPAGLSYNYKNDHEMLDIGHEGIRCAI